jgi:hypothetical protein
MEELANAMYVTLEEMLKEYCNKDRFSVLTMNAAHWSVAQKFFLPSIDGRTVEISADRPDSLMRWKLQFFSKYGDLNLDVQFVGNDVIQVEIRAEDNKNEDGFPQYIKDRKERERSDAALYESMRNVKRY